MHPVYVTLWTGCGRARGVLTDMRLLALLFTAILAASPAGAQQEPVSSPAGVSSPTQDGPKFSVSLGKIREALEATPSVSLWTIDERPTFRVQILERQKIAELLATLNFKTGPIPAGGLYMAEQQRVMFPSVDNPLRQPLAAFNQPELLTILIENLVGKYLASKTLGAISNAEQARAEAAARDEVRTAVSQYCSAQPNQGAGIQICDTPVR
jgi:hypothetical protein